MIGCEGDRILFFFLPLLMNQLAFLLKIDFAVNSCIPLCDFPAFWDVVSVLSSKMALTLNAQSFFFPDC